MIHLVPDQKKKKEVVLHGYYKEIFQKPIQFTAPVSQNVTFKRACAAVRLLNAA